MTMTPPAGRLPWAPLERLLRARADSADYATAPVLGLGIHHGLWCDATAAVLLDTSRRQVAHWKAGGLTVRAADRCAAWLSLNPRDVWGNAWVCAEIGECVRRQHRKLIRRNRLQIIVDEAVRLALAGERARRRAVVVQLTQRPAMRVEPSEAA